MLLNNYGVLKGTPINRALGTGNNPHFQIHVVDDTTDYRIAMNVQSRLAHQKSNISSSCDLSTHSSRNSTPSDWVGTTCVHGPVGLHLTTSDRTCSILGAWSRSRSRSRGPTMT